MEPVPLRVAHSSEVRNAFEGLIRREGDGLTYLVNYDLFHRASQPHQHISPAHIYWFSQTSPDVKEALVNVSDGEYPGLAVFIYSTWLDDKVLVPDQHFFRDHGYFETAQMASKAPDWADRDDTIFWRGATTNNGYFSLDPADVANPLVQQRLRLAVAAKGMDKVDIRFVDGINTHQAGHLEAEGLLAGFRSTAEWANDKFAIDVDGNSNAWCNLMQRLHLGCCVLKVDSQMGFRQWYYDQLEPFGTHVPVRADLSDLAEQIDWVRSHPAQAREIARAGQAMAQAHTFEAATRYAVDAIEGWAAGHTKEDAR